MSTALAPDTDLNEAVAALQSDEPGAGELLDRLIQDYPDDPRLHFMKGSLLAGSARLIEAHRSLARAVEIAPDYALARYQLGFFELTSGEPQKALGTWGPLLAEGPQSCFRRFVEGMTHLIRDEFDPAIACFEQGIALNLDNEPLNGDVRLLIAECRKLADATRPQAEDVEHSATSLMLSRFGGSGTLQ